ncbi:MAG: PaaI family thioesterase [Deltaproteobacteria bacterium]|nr:PaaI family thioesterase [Deltaproteobacteria bacterium]MBN2672100.1 PaaI family thioesterase [Deltaproteobacteria bacterium]
MTHALKQDKKTVPISHANCIFCGRSHPLGLGMRFALNDDHSVETTFTGNSLLQGYRGILHGGVIAGLLDAAMTNCLFLNGIEAYTADLNVRYRHPIPYNADLKVIAQITNERSVIYELESFIYEGARVMAKANARFMKPFG